MRNIINISVPEMLKKEIEREVSSGGYASTSEFFRNLLRDWKRNNLLRELQQSRAEVAAGKGKVLRSLRDLR
jgi:Arc/MetJ-type ribon-helix-helix transcriptional regulator